MVIFCWSNQIMESLHVTYFYMHLWIDFFFFERRRFFLHSLSNLGLYFCIFLILFWELRWNQYWLLLHIKIVLNFPLFSHFSVSSHSMYVCLIWVFFYKLTPNKFSPPKSVLNLFFICYFFFAHREYIYTCKYIHLYANITFKNT